MSRLALLVLTGALMSGAAAAEEVRLTCKRAGDERRIEVVQPGEVGASCDVRYTRVASGRVSTPYYANSSTDYCVKSAKALADNLKEAGFSCAPIGQTQLARLPAPSTAPVSAPAPTPAPSSSAPSSSVQAATAEAAPALSEEPETIVMTAVAQPEAQPEPVEPAEPAPQQAVSATPASVTPAETAVSAAPEPDAELEADMNAILAQPPVEKHAAVRGPAQLTAQVAETPVAAPRATPVGRLVGAEPEAAPVPAQPAPVAATPVTKAAATVKPSAASLPARKPADIIRATLMAQAAAWNEGNLDAFMAAYAKSDQLKFISDGAVAKGWTATMKRYRDEYAQDNKLGQLGFERMEIDMITDDVALATGRYNLVKNAQTHSGVFSLVMQRTNGVWRIVHDHSTSTPAN